MSLFCWTQRKIFWRMWETEQFWGTIDFHSILFSTMEVNCSPKQPRYKLSSEYLPLCSAEQRNSYRFGTTWGWVNNDRIFIFGWTVPLNVKKSDIIFYNRSQNSVRSRFQSLHRQTPSKLLLFYHVFVDLYITMNISSFTLSSRKLYTRTTRTSSCTLRSMRDDVTATFRARSLLKSLRRQT